MSNLIVTVFFLSFVILTIAKGVTRIRARDSWWEKRLMNGDPPSNFAKRQIARGKPPPSRGAVLIIAGSDFVAATILFVVVVVTHN